MKNNTSDYSDSLKKYLSDSKPQDETSPVVHSSMGGKFSLSSINQDLIFINKKSIQYCEDSLKSAKNDYDLVTLEIDKLKIEIDKEQKNVDNLIQYLLPMRQGKEVSCVLDEFGYQPEDEITLKTGEKIKAKDYTGEITHKVKIEKNFILIDEKEALTYDTRAKMWR